MPNNIRKDIYKYIILHDTSEDSVNGETGTNDWRIDGLKLRTNPHQKNTKTQTVKRP